MGFRSTKRLRLVDVNEAKKKLYFLVTHTKKKKTERYFKSNNLTLSLKIFSFTAQNLSDLFSLITGRLSHHKIYEIRQIESQIFDKTKTFSAS